LGKLVNLQKLDISENAITALPADVSGLTALQKLNAKRNKIECIPESATVTETGGFYSLTELNLAHNQVLPRSHFLFFSLEICNRSLIIQQQNLQLESWSSALWTSEALQVVNLTANRLPEVPAEISYLYNLTHLHLNANRITVVANELGQLAALDTLELSFNDLEAVPADLGYLAALRVLSLGYNRLSGEALPDLSALSALEQLFLAGNPLQHVPGWVGSLPALSQLHLHLVRPSSLLFTGENAPGHGLYLVPGVASVLTLSSFGACCNPRRNSRSCLRSCAASLHYSTSTSPAIR
jgi:Leucine-rich repeat (LRR) protein